MKQSLEREYKKVFLDEILHQDLKFTVFFLLIRSQFNALNGVCVCSNLDGLLEALMLPLQLLSFGQTA